MATNKKRKKKAEVMAEDGSMTLTGHLKELRNRLIICAVVFVVGVVVSLAYADRLIDLLTAMGRDYYQFVSIAPQEKLMQYFRVSILAGVVVTVPVAFYNIYAFAKPGLKKSESTFFKLVMLLGLILFCVGVLFAYKLMMPFMLRFLSTGIEGAEYIQTTTSIESYVNLCLTMFIIFGCVFETVRFGQSIIGLPIAGGGSKIFRHRIGIFQRSKVAIRADISKQSRQSFLPSRPKGADRQAIRQGSLPDAQLAARDGECGEADAASGHGTQNLRGTGEQRGARSHHVIDQQDVAAGEPFGPTHGKGPLDIGGPFAAALEGLARGVPAPPHALPVHRNPQLRGDSLGQILRLVVAPPAPLEGVQRQRDNHIDPVVEAALAQAAPVPHPHLPGRAPSSAVLEGVDQPPPAAPVHEEEKSRGTLDGNQSPALAQHGVVGLAPVARQGRRRPAERADAPLAAYKRLPADGAAGREKQRRQVGEDITEDRH